MLYLADAGLAGGAEVQCVGASVAIEVTDVAHALVVQGRVHGRLAAGEAGCPGRC
jgi:hypothetical protein